MDILNELQAWLKAQTDGMWEQDYGITIESTDNPGWWVKVHLKGTSLISKPFQAFSRGEEGSTNWLRCYLKDETFHGAGDTERLKEILEYFTVWVKS